MLWEASDRICGKRLRPLIPLLVDALERHGHLQLDASVRSKLHVMSASTIDRMLVPIRSAGKTTKPKVPAVRASVPIRTFGDWKDPEPGYMEADLVAHCGGNIGGSFVHTLVLTDIATGGRSVSRLPSGIRCSSSMRSGAFSRFYRSSSAASTPTTAGSSSMKRCTLSVRMSVLSSPGRALIERMIRPGLSRRTER